MMQINLNIFIFVLFYIVEGMYVTTPHNLFFEITDENMPWKDSWLLWSQGCRASEDALQRPLVLK